MSQMSHLVGSRTYLFADLRELLAKASPARSGDYLAGVAAGSAEERVAAQMALSALPLTTFLNEAVVPYELDEVTRLILDTHDAAAFAPIRHLTVSDFRDWLLGDEADEAALARLAPGITPGMAAAVSKVMRIQDLVLAARKCRVVTRFRSTIGPAGTLSTRLQSNHPLDDASGIAASLFDGLMYGSGDAVIGINPATDNVSTRPTWRAHSRRRGREPPSRYCCTKQSSITMTTAGDTLQHPAPRALAAPHSRGRSLADHWLP